MSAALSPELAGALTSATGVVAHSASIGRFLRKLGYTYKKSHWSRPNGCAHGYHRAYVEVCHNQRLPSVEDDTAMTRGHLQFAATHAVNGIGVAAVIGILFALVTGQDYHPLAVLAACIYLLLRPLLYWIGTRAKRNSSKNVPP